MCSNNGVDHIFELVAQGCRPHFVVLHLAEIVASREKALDHIKGIAQRFYLTLQDRSASCQQREPYTWPWAWFWLPNCSLPEGSWKTDTTFAGCKMHSLILPSRDGRLHDWLVHDLETKSYEFCSSREIGSLSVANVGPGNQAYEAALRAIASTSRAYFPVLAFPEKPCYSPEPTQQDKARQLRDLQSATGLSQEAAEQLLASGVDHMRDRQPLPPNRMWNPQV
jgi:hypothetical protein